MLGPQDHHRGGLYGRSRHPLVRRLRQAGLASKKWRGIVSACFPFFEMGGAEEVERQVPPDGIVEAVDIGQWR
jgi:hypothetical protein